MSAPEFLFDGPARARLTIALAHGAGAPMDSPFMNDMAAGLAGYGLRVARFEFPYMAARRRGGARGGPNPAAVLESSWMDAIEALGGGDRVIVGGKSMGGRIATMVADRAGARGAICLGYPFHPPGRPEQTRTAHLESLRTKTLIIQGERDTFGTPDDVAAYALSSQIRVRWLPDGDHSFKPRARSGHTLEAHMAQAIEWSAEFARALAG